MKKNKVSKTVLKAVISALFITFTLSSCESTKAAVNNAENQEDSYSVKERTEIKKTKENEKKLTENDSVQTTEEEIPSDSYDETEEYDSLNSSKSNNSGILSLFTKSKFVEYDSTSMFTPAVFGGLKQYAASAVYNPKDGNAGYGCVYMAGYYYVLMDAKSRAAVKRAVNAYLSDFSENMIKMSDVFETALFRDLLDRQFL